MCLEHFVCYHNDGFYLFKPPWQLNDKFERLVMRPAGSIHAIYNYLQGYDSEGNFLGKSIILILRMNILLKMRNLLAKVSTNTVAVVCF